jgi:putative membrane-bound dehydrogenase-like protein
MIRSCKIKLARLSIRFTNRSRPRKSKLVSLLLFGFLAGTGSGLSHPALGQSKPLAPAEAPKHMTLPDGFHVSLFVGEPDIVQPIAFTFDDRGRLWVVECTSYPDWEKDWRKGGHDRILIFEDRAGTGHFDHCKVFWDKGCNISGIQVGFGGVWICAIPNVYFIPDRDGDDVPDGPPEVVLDGWSMEAKHNVFSSLTWGPDGWLYGCNGILATSKVGKPGTLDNQRVLMNCGVWRLHPITREFEVVASGTTNPWGLDFDDYGEMFITNCVIKHLWHVIPGAHFQRMYGQDFNPHWYSLMASCADHIHWAGGTWESSRGGVGSHSDAGGGHAHVGAMVYLGDNWPQRYRNTIFMCNLHGNRVNNDILERKGSGYVAHHGKDFLFANDPWFRGISIQYGPDGGVYLSDWTDTGECHNYDRVDRGNGRIYKVVYDKTLPFHEDLAKLSDAELVQRQLHKNDWHVRHARRILQERAAQDKLAPETNTQLLKILDTHPDVTRKLRALWALHGIGGLTESQRLELLGHPEETIRGWAIQLSLDDRHPSPAFLDKLAEMAVHDPSAWVRRYLASALQRLPVKDRWRIAEGLIGHSDADDLNLPLLTWYGIEPLVSANPEKAVSLIGEAKISLVREYLARRVTLLEADAAQSKAPAGGLRLLMGLLERKSDPAIQLDVLTGIETALAGQRRLPMPDGWSAQAAKLTQSPSSGVREKTLLLSLIFGDPGAQAAMRRIVQDPKAPLSSRQKFVEALAYSKNPQIASLLQELIADAALRGLALRMLAGFADEKTPKAILGHYASLTEEEKSDAIHTLASRPTYARALLEAVEKGQVPRRDISAFNVRQMMALQQKDISDRLAKIWGSLRPASKEKAERMAQYKALLTPAYIRTASLSQGRQVFARNCASCHRLFDQGGAIGPELTGSQRANLDYVLENLLDPSAIVPFDYRVTILETKDGRYLTGIIKQENDLTVTVQTQNDAVMIPKNKIESRNLSPLSLMPDGLLDKMSHEEIRDLVAYLASPAQVPLPKEQKRREK